jgi:hypothetical protein
MVQPIRLPKCAYTQRDAGLAEMKGDPLLNSLEMDSRYVAFLQKMKLPVD